VEFVVVVLCGEKGLFFQHSIEIASGAGGGVFLLLEKQSLLPTQSIFRQLTAGCGAGCNSLGTILTVWLWSKLHWPHQVTMPSIRIAS
jgi:hypothetical protein